MKRFILSVGEKMLAVAVVGGLIYVLFLAVTTLNNLSRFGQGGLGMLLFFAILVIGTAVVVLSVFLIYLIIDIRDKLDILVRLQQQQD